MVNFLCNENWAHSTTLFPIFSIISFVSWKAFDNELTPFFEMQVDCVSYPTQIHMSIDHCRELQEIFKAGLPFSEDMVLR